MEHWFKRCTILFVHLQPWAPPRPNMVRRQLNDQRLLNTHHLFVCACLCTCVCAHVCASECVCAYLCVYVCLWGCVCFFVCTPVCALMHACVCVLRGFSVSRGSVESTWRELRQSLTELLPVGPCSVAHTTTDQPSKPPSLYAVQVSAPAPN